VPIGISPARVQDLYHHNDPRSRPSQKLYCWVHDVLDARKNMTKKIFIFMETLIVKSCSVAETFEVKTKKLFAGRVNSVLRKVSTVCWSAQNPLGDVTVLSCTVCWSGVCALSQRTLPLCLLYDDGPGSVLDRALVECSCTQNVQF